MRDILISSAVCVACLLVALISQLVSPTPPAVASPVTTTATATAVSTAAPAAAAAPVVAAASQSANPFELDPRRPQPHPLCHGSRNPSRQR